MFPIPPFFLVNGSGARAWMRGIHIPWTGGCARFDKLASRTLGYLAWKDWLRAGLSYRSERSMKGVFAAGGALEVASWENCCCPKGVSIDPGGSRNKLLTSLSRNWSWVTNSVESRL